MTPTVNLERYTALQSYLMGSLVVLAVLAVGLSFYIMRIRRSRRDEKNPGKRKRSGKPSR